MFGNKKILLGPFIFLAFVAGLLFIKNRFLLEQIVSVPLRIFSKTADNFRIIGACYTPDGTNFSKKKLVASLFGLTDGIRLKDGKILLTGIDFRDRTGMADKQSGYKITSLGFLISTDGWKFKSIKLAISGLKNDIIAYGDPIIVKLPDGNYRMYFTDSDNEAHLMSAYSKDGYNYQFEGKVTGKAGVPLDAVDFTVLYEKKAQKYLIYTRSEDPEILQVLESSDGRYFTKRFTIRTPFSLQFSIVDEGEYYVAYGRPLFKSDVIDADYRYPVKAISKDGLNWQLAKEQPVGPWKGNRTYCSPTAVIKMDDGYYFY